MMEGLKLFEIGEKRYQPNSQFKYKNDRQYVLDQQRLAALVGTVAIGLPFIMLFAVFVVGNCFYDSISHFYYTQLFGDIFVVALAFIGTFLIAYRGENPKENQLAGLTGLSTFVVALIPTTGLGCPAPQITGRILADLPITATTDNPDQYFELFRSAGLFHLSAAAILFIFLAYYSLNVFTRTIPSQHYLKNKQLTPEKMWRNRIYKISGALITISILAILSYSIITTFTDMKLLWWNDNNLTFWFEALALWAFGASWMVKGRFWGNALLDPRDRKAAAAAK